MNLAPGVPAWLHFSLPHLENLTDEQAFRAVMGIRAISWNWRFWEAVRRPRLLRGLGRRHYGVLAQDVEARLGPHVPDVVVCDRGARCPRHGGAGGDCAGRLKVRYDLVALVTVAAARHLNELLPQQRLDVVSDLPEAPTTAVQRYCHDAIAAVHAAATTVSRYGPQQSDH